MTLKLLRLEAINLSYVVDDTEDLSTRRGGGYMLLQAVRDLTKCAKKPDDNSELFEHGDKIEPVSTGASIGLFKVTGKIDSNELIQSVYNYLNGNSAYRHATFAVTIAEGRENEFRVLTEQTISKVRWHQMQSLNFTTYWGGSTEICEIDEILPAVTNTYLPGDSKKKNVSQSIYDRRESGKKLRQKFYQTELTKELVSQYQLFDLINRDKNDQAFVNHTEALSQFNSEDTDYISIPSNLDGKMAVFYTDGNSFGKIQKSCENNAALNKLDRTIRSYQRELLAEILQFLRNTSLGKNDGKLRFETLLWGGDEFLFLIPAWLGLEFTQKFFELTQDWKYLPDSNENNAQKLTHAAGLVFASHAAPISQLQKLAKKLADYGKDTDKTQNTVSWIVLESFDHAGDNMDDYWQRSGIAQNGWQQLLLTQTKLQQLRQTLIPLKDILPRSAIVRVLRSLAAGKVGDEMELLRRSYESVQTAIEEAGMKGAFENLWETITHNAWQSSPTSIPPEDAVAWTLLMELWDYILPDACDQTESAR
ncbi:hypothetical protein SAMN05421690_101067 [Nitrosomonas sp. Nm51]|uniref:Cas10/Cmr2 second palm domain-containing protein n=1 Tax=Nitrosomonas sp. Nm51 TaxID=133720 RepID=UPI0008AF08B0|nr:hypothetical protein [Nitrosomonas sp. Nm51]SER16333.1 hypothetical protein SAMN05421690_101067 [Nitrosomonas sp. Nm51]